VLAYSTVSQLGYMFMGVGVGAYASGVFHLVTHAFFKALLFLVAGSLIHAVHTNDIFKMGRLTRVMPVTCACFAAGALALSGIFPTAGFFSKDEVLAGVLAAGHPIGFAILVLTAGMTAFYTGRAFFVATMGSNETPGHPHEAPPAMKLPLVVLALLAVVAGLAARLIPGLFSASIAPRSEALEHAPLFVPALAMAAALTGLVLAYVLYQRRGFDPGAVRRAFGPLVTVLERRWYVDDVFEGVYRLVYLKVSNAVGWFDRFIVDGVVNAVSWGTWLGAGRLTALQSGRVQDALYATAFGLVVIVWLAWKL